MKRKLFAGVLCISLFTGGVFAQEKRNCGTMNHFEQLVQKDPSILVKRQEIERQTEEFLQNGGLNPERATITIPVVVHVVYNTSTQNISDAQIKSQIDVLNADFRRLNADKVNTPSAFASVAADVNINFCLATVDPTGAATTGIIRKSTTVTSFYDNDAVKYSTQGGSNAWTTSKYLNIWVCNLGSGLLGYAQFPGGPAATDGVVIGYNYFGTTGTLTAPYNKGRTATHEVGHWLNLYHIWGDASCGNDMVSDTPTQLQDNSGCPSYPHPTCNNTSDMFMNYMDYTNDACMNMFSAGQSARMNALFTSTGARYSLVSSTGCGSGTPTTPSYCASNGTDASYEYIANIKLNTINNTSASNGGYGNFTSISTSLTKGSTYTITMTPGFGTTQTYPEFFNVYIDYNLDKDFADAGELVHSATAGVTAATSKTFTVPTTALTGSARMRIVMKDGAVTGPCETFQYGEVEDYTINIVAPATATSNAVTIGTGTGTTGVIPYGTFNADERAQFIITKAELVAGGFTSVNNKIKYLAFNVATAAGVSMNAFTIKIMHTTAASYSVNSFLSTTGASTVFSGNVNPVAGWNTYNFSSAFTYDGNSNLLIDICWNNSAAGGANTSVRYTPTTAYMALSRRADVAAGGVCGYTTGPLTYNRPNVRFGFSSVAAREDNQETDAVEMNGISMTDRVSLYPNPATDQLNISYFADKAGNPVIINIYNITGKLVSTRTVFADADGINSERVELGSQSELAEGMYICTVNIDGKVETKKFMLKK